MREYYDLWDRFSSGISPQGRVKETVRRTFIRAADTYFFKHHVKKLFTISQARERSAGAMESRAERGAAPAAAAAPISMRRVRRLSVFRVAADAAQTRRSWCCARSRSRKRVARGCVIGGEGEERPRLEQLARELGLDGRVSFTGHLSESGSGRSPRAMPGGGFRAAGRRLRLRHRRSVRGAEARDHVLGQRRAAWSSSAPARTGSCARPDPAALARAYAELTESPGLAERLGAQGRPRRRADVLERGGQEARADLTCPSCSSTASAISATASCASSSSGIRRRGSRSRRCSRRRGREAARRPSRIAPTFLISVVLVEDGALYVRSTAALRMARHLGFPGSWRWVFLVVPSPLRDWVYEWVARHRYGWFGKRDTCMVPTPDVRARFLDMSVPWKTRLSVAYRSPLETRLAKKVTRAITEFGLIEDGDRVMVGLSGGKDSWALIQILDVLPAPGADRLLARRRQRQLRLHGLPPRSRDHGLRRAPVGVPRRAHDHRRRHGRHPRRWRDAVFAVRAAAPRGAVPAGEGGRRDEDRARPSPRRLHRDGAAEPVLPGIAQGDAGAARLRQQAAHRHPSAGLRHGGRGARLHPGSLACR